MSCKWRPPHGLHPSLKDEPRFEELPQLYIEPVAFIDCRVHPRVPQGLRVYPGTPLSDKVQFVETNAAYYA